MKIYDEPQYQRAFEDLATVMQLTPQQLLRHMLRLTQEVVRRARRGEHRAYTRDGQTLLRPYELTPLAMELQVEYASPPPDIFEPKADRLQAIERWLEAKVLSCDDFPASTEALWQLFTTRLNSRKFLRFVDNPRLQLNTALAQHVSVINSLLEFHEPSITGFEAAMQCYLEDRLSKDEAMVGLAVVLFMEAWVTGCLPGQTPVGQRNHPLTVERVQHWSRVLAGQEQLMRYMKEEPAATFAQSR